VQNWLDAVRSRKRPVADVETGHRVVTACHLGCDRLPGGRKVRWMARRGRHRDAEAQKLTAKHTRTVDPAARVTFCRTWPEVSRDPPPDIGALLAERESRRLRFTNRLATALAAARKAGSGKIRIREAAGRRPPGGRVASVARRASGSSAHSRQTGGLQMLRAEQPGSGFAK